MVKFITLRVLDFAPSPYYKNVTFNPKMVVTISDYETQKGDIMVRFTLPGEQAYYVHMTKEEFLKEINSI